MSWSGKSQRVRSNGGSNYLCGSEQVAHFGLGVAGMVDVTASWLDGFATKIDQVAVNQRLTVAAALPLVNTVPPVARQDTTVVVSGLRPGETAYVGLSEAGTGEGPYPPHWVVHFGGASPSMAGNVLRSIRWPKGGVMRIAAFSVALLVSGSQAGPGFGAETVPDRCAAAGNTAG